MSLPRSMCASSKGKDQFALPVGIFRKRRLKARIGRNPATGEQIKIPARTRLRFTPAKALKDSVPGVAAAAAKTKTDRSKKGSRKSDANGSGRTVNHRARLTAIAAHQFPPSEISLWSAITISVS